MEAELSTLRNTIETERQESKVLIEKMELEVAERKLSFHNLQEEMRHLLEQLEQAGQAQAVCQILADAEFTKIKQHWNT